MKKCPNIKIKIILSAFDLIIILELFRKSIISTEKNKKITSNVGTRSFATLCPNCPTGPTPKNIFVFDEQIIIVLTTACANTDYEGNYA